MNPSIVVKYLPISLLLVFQKKLYDALSRVDPSLENKIYHSIEHWYHFPKEVEDDEDWASNYKYEEVTQNIDYCAVMIFSRVPMEEVENSIYNALSLIVDDLYISREMF